jgi:hypothetical protein
MATEAEHRIAIDRFRQYYDETLCRHVGSRPPDPFPGQTVNEYRVEALRAFKKTYLPQTHQYAKINFRKLRASHRNDNAGLNIILAGFEPDVLAACLVEANNPVHVPKGELKEIKVRDATGVHTFTKFIGQECFTKMFGRPGKRVVINRNPADTSPLREWHGARL